MGTRLDILSPHGCVVVFQRLGILRGNGRGAESCLPEGLAMNKKNERRLLVENLEQRVVLD
ncbi:MAG: hypothetical protein ACQESR_10965, partial [Planctomycetota bacterium]